MFACESWFKQETNLNVAFAVVFHGIYLTWLNQQIHLKKYLYILQFHVYKINSNALHFSLYIS